MTKSDLTRTPADPSTSSHKGRPCPRLDSTRLDSTTRRPKPPHCPPFTSHGARTQCKDTANVRARERESAARKPSVAAKIQSGATTCWTQHQDPRGTFCFWAASLNRQFSENEPPQGHRCWRCCCCSCRRDTKKLLHLQHSSCLPRPRLHPRPKPSSTPRLHGDLHSGR